MAEPPFPRTVLVTGAAHGIGRAICLAFAAEGDRVVVNDREEGMTDETVGLVHDSGGEAIGVGADVGDRQQVETMFERAREAFGPVGVVVNNAAWYEFINPSQQSVESFEKNFNVDVTAMFHTMQCALPGMRELDGGVIVSIASLNAYVTIPQNATYSAAKAAMVALTRSFALELGPMGIRVCSLSPGFTATPAVQVYLDSLTQERRIEEMGKYDERIPLRRLARPEEIADGVVFLASPRASFITGTDLLVDGGMYCLNKAFSYNP
jgi:NAD(P)-dependent dehydrogenase (short-subunit alcohol dehydrogenase family)